jgi:hypothetical protein
MGRLAGVGHDKLLIGLVSVAPSTGTIALQLTLTCSNSPASAKGPAASRCWPQFAARRPI